MKNFVIQKNTKSFNGLANNYKNDEKIYWSCINRHNSKTCQCFHGFCMHILGVTNINNQSKIESTKWDGISTISYQVGRGGAHELNIQTLICSLPVSSCFLVMNDVNSVLNSTHQLWELNYPLLKSYELFINLNELETLSKTSA